MRPLIRLLMHAGVTFPVLADLMRGLYIDVALADFLRDGKARTDSRVSLLTGVHRKEIRRLRELPRGAETIPPAVTVSSQIIARWLGLADHVDAEGRPLPLPRASAGGAGPSFDALVESVTTDIRPRAVLDDWLSQGFVTLDADDRVHLNTLAFIPRGGVAEQMFYFARNLHDHIAAAAANVSAVGPAPFIDRSVHYDELDEATARRLEQIAREAAQRALVEINRAALALLESSSPGPAVGAASTDSSANDRPAAAGRARVNFGVYVYRDTDRDADNDPGLTTA